MKKYKKALVILRRDIRLFDNTALNFAMGNAKDVTVGFIFNPKQTDPKNNEYFSQNAFQFLCESLTGLDEELQQRGSRLAVFCGIFTDVLPDLKEYDLLCFNKDYTPFAKKRDAEMTNFATKSGIKVFSFHDALLTVPGQVLTGGGNMYKVFTPFKRQALNFAVPTPEPLSEGNLTKNPTSPFTLATYFKKHPYAKNKNIFVNGGRKNALKKLKKVPEIENYSEARNMPFLDATTCLSAAHKFGVVSIRESYEVIKNAFGADSQMMSELYWRDFYTLVAENWPRVFGASFKEKYDKVMWEKDEESLAKWKEGKTGFLLVDAGMRQLNETGWMHNRVRMVVASFLVKDLHINWQEGEKYFATKLVDYDPAVNNGSWQWAASTGTDAQPYFRIFNPWSQQKRFDPDCIYIKKWIPELQSLTPKEIHNWKGSLMIDYPVPIVDHKPRAAKAKLMFRDL